MAGYVGIAVFSQKTAQRGFTLGRRLVAGIAGIDCRRGAQRGGIHGVLQAGLVHQEMARIQRQPDHADQYK